MTQEQNSKTVGDELKRHEFRPYPDGHYMHGVELCAVCQCHFSNWMHLVDPVSRQDTASSNVGGRVQSTLTDSGGSHEAEIVAALKEVMAWIDNWSPDFIQDDEWPETFDKVERALLAVKQNGDRKVPVDSREPSPMVTDGEK
jgi:hypothetical protein